MKKLIIIAILLLPSCVKTLTIEEIGRKPTNKETINFVKQYIEENYYDSDVKHLRVKEPIYSTIMVGEYFPMPQSGWAICYQVNAKNIYGVFTGVKKHSIGVQNMTLKPHGDVELGWHYCKNAKWIN